MKVAILSISLLAMAACAENVDPSQASQALVSSKHEDPPAPERSVNSRHEANPAANIAVKGGDILASPHSSLLALSAEEAGWLARHDYPTPEEMNALRTYDLTALESAMRNRRDPKAAALVGHLRALRGDIDGAASAFGVGANLGSLYAWQQLALVGTQKATGLPVTALAQADQGNLGIMVSQLEVARMLGDHRAQAMIDRLAVNFDWDVYGKHVLTQTAIFMDQYGEYARATGARVVGPDPRPNAQLWEQLRTDPDAMVNVYTR